MSVLDLARPDIRALQPYSSARMEAHGGTVLLNANESPWPPFGAGETWNRYPEPQPAMLVQHLAGLYGMPADRLLVGRGSDEGIDLLVRAFCRAGEDAILISPPTFGMYATCARIQGARVIEVPLREDFALDADAMLAAVTPAVKLVFVCAPNNPTGQGVAREAILHMAEALSGRALLVVDEAYIEFATTPGVTDCVGSVENLVVLRTLSKAWALAGVRIGVLLAEAQVVALLRKLMPPYPLPVPCVEAALRAVSPGQQIAVTQRIAVTVRERECMREFLSGLACVRAVLPSQANFLAVRLHDADASCAALLDAGIVVRDVRRYPRMGDTLRITVGSPDENQRVLEVLRTIPSARTAVHVEQPA